MPTSVHHHSVTRTAKNYSQYVVYWQPGHTIAFLHVNLQLQSETRRSTNVPGVEISRLTFLKQKVLVI